MKNSKLINFEDLRSLRERHADAKIVHCHGVFDVLHAGHLAYFRSARKFGDILVVTLTTDEYVNKGPGRPHFNSIIRADMVAALEVVDYVALSRFPTAVPAIEMLRPHFYVKGPDYKDKNKDVTGAIYEEELAAKRGQGQLVFTDDETHSSSNLLNKFFNHWSEDQQRVIDAVKKEGGFPLIEDILDRIAREEVAVIGEPIVDTYIFCAPENISSKSPSISAKFLYEENYAGGSLAIANHLADFVRETSLYITHGGERYFRDLLQQKLDPRIRVFAQEIPDVPTPRKTRFIAEDRGQRIFEITDLRSDQWSQHSPKQICAQLMEGNSPDRVNILADFGHGFFEKPVLESMTDLRGFIGLNVQTNSSNFGFNPFTKHKKFSYLSIDTKEVRVAYHDRYTPSLDLARRLHEELKSSGASCAMTLGSAGAYFFPGSSGVRHFSPTFADSVVDSTGAGDAFFALTTLLVKVGCPHVVVPFIGNVFAGLKTKIMGNKSPVSKAQLVKAISSILK